MNIRLAAENDIPALLSLLLQVGQVHHEIRPDIFRGAARKYTESDLSELLKDQNSPIFVLTVDGCVEGYCFCKLRSYDGSGVCTRRRELYIDDLCVDENCRGQGVATALYRHVCGYAKEIGCNFVTLNVWCGNDSAMHFYEKMGLRPRSIMMETPLEDA